MRNGRLLSAAGVAAALVALAWLCHARSHELAVALRSIPLPVSAALVALHLATLIMRSEAWRLALAAVDDRVPPRTAVHVANAGAFVAGAFESHSALPARVLLLARLAGDRAPRPAQIALADAPIFVLELCLTAAVLTLVTSYAAVLLVLGVVAALLGRHFSRRFRSGSLARGLAVLGDGRRRAALAAWVGAITALQLGRVSLTLAACGLPAGAHAVGAAFAALGAFGLLPLGPSAPAGATMAAAGTGGHALAAGLVLAATSLSAVLVYGAGVAAFAAARAALGGRRSARAGAALGDEEGRRRRAGDLGRDVAQRPALPLVAQHAVGDDVVARVAVPMPAAQHALAREADALERGLRAAIEGARPGRQAVHAERAEGERGDQRLRLAVDAPPPPVAAEPGADGRAAVAAREL